MAVNLHQYDARCMSLVCTEPATPVAGDPVLVGDLPGVALTDEGDGGNDAGRTTVDTGGAYKILTLGPVTAGDIAFYDPAATPHKLAAAGPTRFGYFLEDIVGATTVEVSVKVGY